MRVLVLALAVAFVAANQGNHVPEFAQSQTYIYRYEAILMGGMAEQGLARAGLKLQSKVLIRRSDANTVVLKLENPEFFEYSGIWPKDDYIPASKLTSALSAQLLTPVKFEYANGVVGKVYAPAAVSETVMNIYKAIINVLQMNIKKTQNVYDLQELGIQGMCKTQYTISDDQKAERIYLTKTRDLNQCQQKIVKDIGLSYLQKCPECETRSSALKGASSSSYVLKPDAAGAQILQATVAEVYHYAPLEIMNGGPQMESKQNLTFVEQQNVPVVPSSNQYLHRGSLMYEFSSEAYQTPFSLLKKDESQLAEVLNNLVTSNKGKVQEEAPLKVIQLIQLFRQHGYEGLQSLWTQNKNRHDHRHWILNVIPAIRSHVALKFIKEKYLAGDLSIYEASQALLLSFQMVKADSEAMKLAQEMMGESKFQENKVLQKIVMLGYGTLVGKHCVEKPDCSPELVKVVQDRLVQAVARQQVEEIISLLKVLGNAGHPAGYKPIQKILPGFGSAAATLPLRVHIEAVLALKNIAKKEPKMVQETAIQLFMNKELDQELRMVAAMVLFETKLPTGLVMTLANTVAKERNLQISSFIYSYMKSMTRSTAPNFAAVAAACNIAIKILSPRLDRLSYRYSRSLYADTYSYPWMVGAAASAYYINEAATIVPKTMVAKARTYLAGAYADVLEFGLRSDGVQEALMKTQNIPQNEQRINKMKAILKALSAWRAEPSSQPLASAYVKIFGQEIAFVNIDKVLVEQVIEYAKEMKQQFSLKKVADSLESGYNLYFAQPLLLSEIRRILPSAVGLPMDLSLYTAAVTAASVEVQATLSPRPTDSFTAAQLLKTDIQMRATVNPSVSAQTFAVMGVNTDLIKAAVMSKAKVHSFVPAKMEARVDIAGGNIKFQMLPHQGIEKIASVEHETVAVARNMNEVKVTPLIPIERVDMVSRETLSSQVSRMASSFFGSQSKSSELLTAVPQHKTGLPLPKTHVRKRCIESKEFGYKLCGETQARNASYIKASPLYAVIGKQVAEFTIIPVPGAAADKIEVEIQVGEKSADKIIKVISMSEEEEILESKNVLMKLKKILVPGLKNGTSSSSSSSSSHSSSSRSSSSRSSLSKSSSSQSASSSSSRNVRKSAAVSRQHSDPRIERRLPQTLNKKSSSSSSSSSSLRSSHRSRSSSSSSSSSSSQSRRERYPMEFVKKHIHQHAVSTGHTNSKSSAQSFETTYNKAKYLAKSVAPIMTILVRGVRADQKVLGYQIAAYIDKPTSRLQVIIVNLAEDNNWRLCVDGMVLSNQKLMSKIGWGQECKQYSVEVTVESGLVDQNPAARLKMSWDKLPRKMEYYMRRLPKYIAQVAVETGLNITKTKYIGNQVKLTMAAASDRSVHVALQTSKSAIYKLGLSLPVPLPIGQSAYDWNTNQNLAEKTIRLLSKETSAECKVVQDKVKTFNSDSYKTEKPHLCSQVLAQDCTDELKFIVLLKNDQATNQDEVNVKIEHINVNFYLRDGVAIVSINDNEMTTSTYELSDGKISISRKNDSISLYAPSFGLEEVKFSAQEVKIRVAHWMKGKTCGLCGTANGEAKQGHRKPNRSWTKDPVTFAHSWVIGGESCRDSSQCLMKHESVKLEKQVNIFGQNSKCYSVEPVLRCLAGCMPVRTTTVNVGYHCVPSDSFMSRPESLSIIQEKSIDLIEATEAHVACRCTAQCS